MDRRVFLGSITGAVIVGSTQLFPVRLHAQTQRSRFAITAIYESVERNYRAGRHKEALRQSLKLVRYSHLDPNWYTYSESFLISKIRFQLTPREPQDQFLLAARGVLETFPGVSGHLREGYQALGRAAYELLKASSTDHKYARASDQSEFATLLLLFSASSPGKERTEWARLAVATYRKNRARVVEDWGDDGMGLRLACVAFGIGGDWEFSADMFGRNLAKPEAQQPARLRQTGLARGFASLHLGQQSFEAEAATAYFNAGRMVEATELLERSRANTPFIQKRRSNTSESATVLERQIAADGTTIAHLSITFAGALVVLSRLVDGRLVRTITFDPEPGGVALQETIVTSGEDPQKLDGLINDYRKARASPIRFPKTKYGPYVEAASNDTEYLIGQTLKRALRDNGIAPGATVQVILPPSLAFLPISMVTAANSTQNIGAVYNLKYADSLASAAHCASVASQRANNPKSIALIALDSVDGGPQFARFENSGIRSITSGSGVSEVATRSRKGRLRWPNSGDYWHITSHAVWDFNKPGKSGVDMGRGNVSTVSDVLATKLDDPPRL
ncbi:MAG: hypothetical protein AAGK01_12355, partial [Pseudomonadota bacterium]